MRSRAVDLAFVATAFAVALGVKAFYSGAGASELAFVLAPSCWLAAHLGGIELVAEEGAGFISHAHRMVVGPACAGVNFLVIAFLAVYLSRRATGIRDGIRGLLIAAVVAYVATILTNGLRIILAAHLWQLGGAGWFTPERLHRLAGVVIYCAAVVILCRAVAPERRSIFIPLVCYLGVAVGIPLLNGAARNRIFVEHAAVVTAVCLLVLALARVLATRRSAPASPEQEPDQDDAREERASRPSAGIAGAAAVVAAHARSAGSGAPAVPTGSRA